MSARNQTGITDEVLIQKCLDGNEHYCRMLFERFYGKMLNVCKRYAKNQDEAKDMVQEGFIRMFKHLKSFNFSGSLEGWIRRVMVTTAINYIKKYHREMVEFKESNLNGTVVNAVAEDKLDAESLLALIQRLSPVYKAVFNLHAIEGYSHQEIAVMLDISESTSRSNLAKARQKLQHYIYADIDKQITY
jgi:RNA polymerase sigma-70 factor (ECF subfamily)